MFCIWKISIDMCLDREPPEPSCMQNHGMLTVQTIRILFSKSQFASLNISIVSSMDDYVKIGGILAPKSLYKLDFVANFILHSNFSIQTKLKTWKKKQNKKETHKQVYGMHGHTSTFNFQLNRMRWQFLWHSPLQKSRMKIHLIKVRHWNWIKETVEQVTNYSQTILESSKQRMFVINRALSRQRLEHSVSARFQILYMVAHAHTHIHILRFTLEKSACKCRKQHNFVCSIWFPFWGNVSEPVCLCMSALVFML